ncbi:hypothetical protein [Frigoribacterium sp. PhB24]|uniref:hypothetical protein n=1 Tax=Frigoribacterium sp. PhB24 TaxID=2485204 RepID=UPI000F4AC0C6|nr:hypothetical protein [Frigoribacterium sp. PhB24]ROS50499.1 hypothetical protein EDF50_2291 [Frigoribacterium sp. PhB24]
MSRLELQIFLTIVAAVAILQTIAAAIRPGGSSSIGIAITAALVCVVAGAWGPDRRAAEKEDKKDGAG